ncbi:S41 family peptidase [Silvimonas iriomotensis]|uniref:S41 family peptidase n=1 Tax=Silvimonas iriomotensis TaxID=449662 RepID=UPI00166F2FDA|nr:S41 family peptidase [Silvimonas iriomotensis]
MSLSRLMLVLLVPVVMSGCAVVDPHRILARQIDRLTVSSTLDEHNREAAFDQVWHTINDSYVDPGFNGVDWAAVGQRYRPLVLNAPDDASFWAELDHMTGELNDAHTRVENPARYAQIKHDKSASLGLGVDEIDGRLIMHGISGMSQAALLGVRSGQELTGVDGQDALAWWQQQRAQVRGGSTAWSRDAYVLRALNNLPAGKVRTLALTRPDGTHLSVELTNEEAASPPWIYAHTLNGNLTYIRFSGFDRQIKPELMKLLDQAARSSGIVIDLRGNGGGDGLMAMDLLSRFVKGEIKGAQVITRDHKPVRLFGFSLLDTNPVLQGDAHPLTAPLAILVDRHSASAAELVAGAAQSLGRAKVFGETTCGCLLGFFDYDPLPGGGALAFSEVDIRLPNGERIEGRGVVPDVSITVTRTALEQGADPTLQSALSWLATEAASAPATAAKTP